LYSFPARRVLDIPVVADSGAEEATPALETLPNSTQVDELLKIHIQRALTPNVLEVSVD
jgi:hypothetical protein